MTSGEPVLRRVRANMVPKVQPRQVIVAHMQEEFGMLPGAARSLAQCGFVYGPRFNDLNLVGVAVDWALVQGRNVHAPGTNVEALRLAIAIYRTSIDSDTFTTYPRYVELPNPEAVPLAHVIAHHITEGGAQVGDQYDAPHWVERKQWLAEQMFAP